MLVEKDVPLATVIDDDPTSVSLFTIQGRLLYDATGPDVVSYMCAAFLRNTGRTASQKAKTETHIIAPALIQALRVLIPVEAVVALL